MMEIKTILEQSKLKFCKNLGTTNLGQNTGSYIKSMYSISISSAL